MTRQISSSLTLFHKVILPILFALGIVNIGVLGLRGWYATPEEMPWQIVLMIVAFLFLSLWLFWPLKKIAIDDNNLYVSDFHTEITIPISEIEKVSEFILSKPRRVTIHLKNPTQFGRKIVFLAMYRPFGFLSSHPIVAELRELARRQTLK